MVACSSRWLATGSTSVAEDDETDASEVGSTVAEAMRAVCAALAASTARLRASASASASVVSFRTRVDRASRLGVETVVEGGAEPIVGTAEAGVGPARRLVRVERREVRWSKAGSTGWEAGSEFPSATKGFEELEIPMAASMSARRLSNAAAWDRTPEDDEELDVSDLFVAPCTPAGDEPGGAESDANFRDSVAAAECGPAALRDEA